MKKLLMSFILIAGCFNSYASDVSAIENFDSSKYLGKWYEIARLPNKFEDKCLPPVTATYQLNLDDQNKIIVTNECNTRDRVPEIAEGMATFVESHNIAKLKVTFLPKFIRWLPFGYGDYWVLNVDYDKVALVGSPDHKYLWILSRSENVPESDLKAISLIAKDQGFDTSQLIYNYTPPSIF